MTCLHFRFVMNSLTSSIFVFTETESLEWFLMLLFTDDRKGHECFTASPSFLYDFTALLSVSVWAAAESSFIFSSYSESYFLRYGWVTEQFLVPSLMQYEIFPVLSCQGSKFSWYLYNQTLICVSHRKSKAGENSTPLWSRQPTAQQKHQ